MTDTTRSFRTSVFASALWSGAAVLGCHDAPPSVKAPATAESGTTKPTSSGGQQGLPARYEVFLKGELIMEVTDRPGVVIAGGAPPPPLGSPPPKKRPFSVYAHALVPGPGVLEAFDEAKSTQQLLERLERLGYLIKPKPWKTTP